MNEFEQLVQEIERVAKDKGLHLHRYQANLGGHRVRIRYAAHHTETKPHNSNMCDYMSAPIGQIEGSTRRCEAYRTLAYFKNVIEEIQRMVV